MRAVSARVTGRHALEERNACLNVAGTVVCQAKAEYVSRVWLSGRPRRAIATEQQVHGLRALWRLLRWGFWLPYVWWLPALLQAAMGLGKLNKQVGLASAWQCSDIHSACSG